MCSIAGHRGANSKELDRNNLPPGSTGGVEPLTTNATDRYTLVSADCHAGGDFSDYRRYLPTSLLEEFDEWTLLYNNPFTDLTDDSRVRNWDSAVRTRDLEADGQVAEVIFPNTIPPFFPSSLLVARPPATSREFELRWAGLQAHNRWLVDWCNELPGRRAGLLQVFPNDIEAAVAEVEWGAASGLKGVLVPAVPPDSPVPALWNEYYDPLWAACQDTGLSVNQHGGAGIPDIDTSPNRNFLMLMEVPFFANRSLWHLILSGVFVRFPELRFVMTEQRVGWVPETLAKMDAFWHLFRTGGVGEMPPDATQLPNPPSSYFHSNCYMGSSFPGPDEADAIRQLGVDRVMWGSDYPHAEGTFPETVAALRHVFADWPADDLHKLLGATAAEVYDLDLTELAGHGIGPLVGEVAEPLDEVPTHPSMAFRPRP
ncbi:MAG: amidohydrolase [Acidimicrobiaceae bacterium]|nr:amidohydrolase [Acidimicrobiaceae bacterium]